MKKLFYFVIFLSFSSLFAATSTTENTEMNFVIAPPPLGYPEFNDTFTMNQKVDLTIAKITHPQFNIAGFGLGYIPRYADKNFGVDLYMGFNFMTGKIMDLATISMIGLDFIPNLELVAINTSFLKAIIFAGYNLSLWVGNYTMSYTLNDQTYSSTTTSNTSLYGLLTGFQFHILPIDEIIISPFAYIKKLQGTTTLTSTYNNQSYSTKSDIPPFTSMTLGFDVIFTPAGLTLSSIFEKRKKETDDIKQIMFSLGFKLPIENKTTPKENQNNMPVEEKKSIPQEIIPTQSVQDPNGSKELNSTEKVEEIKDTAPLAEPTPIDKSPTN